MITQKPKIPIVAVVGATASGKTSLGIELAKELGGEIVSCDSMQIYKGLDIATAKPTKEEMQGIKHHLIDIVDPEQSFSVGQFCEMAHAAIEDIHSRGKMPILVGGTGLYVDNTVMKTTFSAPARDEKLSNELLEFSKTYGNEALYEILLKEDAGAAQKLHPNDVKRVIRAIETVRTTGKTRAQLDSESRSKEDFYDCTWLAIDMGRSVLYDRINRRVDLMLDMGLVEETREKVYPIKNTNATALQAIGYREVLMYLDGLCSFNEAIELLKRNTRRYAKRQLTWFSANKNIKWLAREDALQQALKLLKLTGFDPRQLN